jgi:hypothetical protein
MQKRMAGLQFVTQVVGLNMLGQVVQLNIAFRSDDAGFAIVFGVVGADAVVLVAHVNVAIGVENFANLVLLIGFQGSDSPLGWALRRRFRWDLRSFLGSGFGGGLCRCLSECVTSQRE